ncbi:MAG TPA: nucleotidyltransferase domain-containing protein [Gammaproteobacteria bacterium]|nr:nucleotidyltransferase domain-containing protein [Gammaproteobacteria bacterium]
MRLTPQQRQAILASVGHYFGPNAHVWLFGSRVSDQRRGGDVDLYIEPEQSSLLAELRCKAQLKEVLDLHVDLVVKRPGHAHPIEQIARETGVRL